MKKSGMYWVLILVISLFIHSCSGGGGGGNNSPSQSANNPPQPTAQGIGIRVGNTGFSQVSPNDPDADQVHSFEITTPPANGTATIDAEGLITYNPDSGFIGNDSLVVTVTDNGAPRTSAAVAAKIMVFDTPNFVIVVTVTNVGILCGRCPL